MRKTKINQFSQQPWTTRISSFNTKIKFFTFPFLLTKNSKLDGEIKKDYYSGIDYVKSQYSLDYVVKVLSINKSTVLQLPMNKLYKTYFGMTEKEMQYVMRHMDARSFRVFKNARYGDISEISKSDIFGKKISELEGQLIKEIRVTIGTTVKPYTTSIPRTSGVLLRILLT